MNFSRGQKARGKVEAELDKVCDEVLELLNGKVNMGEGEGKVWTFFLRGRGLKH